METPAMRKLAVIAFALFLVGIFVFAQNNSTPPVSTPTTAPKIASLPAEAQQAMASIDAERIRAHVKFLASDLLEGRGTGQRGGDIAAEYIATEFSLYGLKPAGDNGSYMQKVPMVGIKTVDDEHLLTGPEKGAPLETSRTAPTTSPWTRPARPKPTSTRPRLDGLWH